MEMLPPYKVLNRSGHAYRSPGVTLAQLLAEHIASALRSVRESGPLHRRSVDNAQLPIRIVVRSLSGIQLPVREERQR